jgi:hypothetical protein
MGMYSGPTNGLSDYLDLVYLNGSNSVDFLRLVNMRCDYS